MMARTRKRSKMSREHAGKSLSIVVDCSQGRAEFLTMFGFKTL